METAFAMRTGSKRIQALLRPQGQLSVAQKTMKKSARQITQPKRFTENTTAFRNQNQNHVPNYHTPNRGNSLQNIAKDRHVSVYNVCTPSQQRIQEAHRS